LKIVKTIHSHPDSVQKTENCSFSDKAFIADKGSAGTIDYFPIHPLLAHRFFGLEVIPATGVTVAVKVELSDYASFDGNEWSISPVPIFTSIQDFNQGLQYWNLGNSLQFILRLEPMSRVAEISLGYEVEFEVTEYLLNFALPEYLHQEYSVSYMTTIGSTGNIDFSRGYNLEHVRNFQVTSLNGKTIPATMGNNRIYITNSEYFNYPAQVRFLVKPWIVFARGLYQIETLPCILIRELPQRNFVTPVRMYGISNEFDYPVGTCDLMIELLIMAQHMADAKAIAFKLIEHIRDRGKIDIPPIDDCVGIQLLTLGDNDPIEFEGGMGVSSSNDVKGGVATTRLKLMLRHVAL
jgi:hypothetical protein